MRSILSATLIFLSIISLCYSQERPNIIIVMTDDQGYYDLSCHGNPIVKTPAIDLFQKNSLKLNNYHVDPTCSPTRAALMTGRYSARVGVWHTIEGRNLLRSREITMADIFRNNGYETGLFGKWHLGDAYPYRPEDRGFSHVVMHFAGGITQSPDYWGNDYFDDIYYANGKHKPFKGFCTDVWFAEAKKFIKKSKAKNKPFFSYIALNAPHGPMRSPKKYYDLYKNKKIPEDLKHFYGMISNIDDNFKSLQKFLSDEKLSENTILIFTTDNGTSSGHRLFKGQHRGSKNSEYEGGHHVPFFAQWPQGEWNSNRQINQLTSHMDILPTFINLLKLKAPQIEFDGADITTLLKGDKNKMKQRTLIVESQRLVTPKKWRKSAVMNGTWRLINGKELFDLKNDPSQKTNIASQHPEIVQQMRADYDKFWQSVSQDHHINSAMILGSDKANPTKLTAHDLLGSANWNQAGIIHRQTNKGHWAVEVEKAGNYAISLRRWPAESDLAIDETINNGFRLQTSEAYLKIAGHERHQKFPKGSREVTFKIKLPAGKTFLEAGFIKNDGNLASACYVYVLNLDSYKGDINHWQTREALGLPKRAQSTDFPPHFKKKKARRTKKVH